MGNYSKAYPVGRKNEGGYVNDPDDKGAETYAGVSRKYYPDCGIWPIIDKIKAERDLHIGDLIDDPEIEKILFDFYRVEKWDKIKGDKIVDDSVATFLYDWSLTSGKAVRQLQRELAIEDDGIVGNGTLAAINAAGHGLLYRLYNARDAYYHYLVNKDPTQQKFLPDWLRRNNELYASLK